jgi:Fe-S-cluster containining protein
MKQNFNKAEWDFFKVALKEEARTIIRAVDAKTTPDDLVKETLADLQKLAPIEDGSETRTDEEIWMQVRNVLMKAAYATRPYCIRCGVCCTKSSPTLHDDDMKLFVDDVLKPEHVVTIRKGEHVYSTTEEVVIRSDDELIKIREVEGARHCRFYDESESACTIYEVRPLQCRRQECWSPESFNTLNDVPKLTRKRLLEPTGVLWDIIQAHEDKCSYDETARIIARMEATKGQTVEDLLELLRIDHYVRLQTAEQFNLDEEAMEFFFGRPLRETIRLYGLELEEHPDGSFMLKMIESEDPEAAQ